MAPVGDEESKAQAEYAKLVASQREWVLSLPAAIKPFYQFSAPNAPTPLYSGPLRMQSEKADHLLDGRIEVVWQPTPQLSYVSHSDFPVEFLLSMDIPDPVPAAADILPEPFGLAAPLTAEPTLSGHLTHLEMGSGRHFAYVMFQLVNFVDYLGAWVRDHETPYHGRLEMRGLGWRLTIDARADLADIQKELRRSGGYAATHCGRLERDDGSTFDRDTAIEMLEGIHWFCSFVTGSPCGPFLPVGFSPQGQPTWSRWGVPTTVNWPPQLGWFDRHNAQAIIELFPQFLSRWLDPFWRRVVYIGVGYYLDANVPRTVQRAIGLGQIVLELLVNSVLVEGNRIDSRDLASAGRAITRLLEHYRIPTQIPTRFAELYQEAERAGWKTGPWAVTALRNEIIHPKRGTAERPFRVMTEAWKLLLWYCEMTLLAFFGYQGVYGNRLAWPRWTGQVEPVPWAQR